MSKQWQTKQQCLMWYGTQESYLQYIHIKLNDQYKQTDVYLLKSIFTSTCIDYSMYFNVFKLSSCFHFHSIHPLCCLHKRTVRLMLKSCVENVIPMCVVTFTGVCEKKINYLLWESEQSKTEVQRGAHLVSCASSSVNRRSVTLVTLVTFKTLPGWPRNTYVVPSFSTLHLFWCRHTLLHDSSEMCG